MRLKHLPTALLGAAVAGMALWLVPASLPAVERAGEPTTRQEKTVAPDMAPAAFQGNPRYTPVVDLVRRVRGCVVNIHSERSVRAASGEELFTLAPSQNRVNGMGTGIILDPRGYIITNHHVVEEVSSLRVRLADGTSAPARVIARDKDEDLALLKIDVPQTLEVMPLGTATDVMVGETVVAIGNAYGYDHTVTVGIVSAIKRDVTLNKDIAYKSLIQTDAAINPGNSGGPLLNIKGELIGVNVAIRAGAQGIGFAIPVDTMMRVAADMISVRRRTGVGHGVVGRDRVTTHNGKIVQRELVVEGVEPGSAAARAGVQPGDVIARVDSKDVACRLDLERHLSGRQGGERFSVEVRRNGLDQQLEMTLESVEAVAPTSGDLVWRRLGMKLQRVNAELVSSTNRQLHGGLVVDDVRGESPAARGGIQRGDILVGLHQWEMLSLENVVYVLTHPDLATLTPLRFYIIRSGQVHRGWIQNLD
ncbi:MAG: trypsin-like peptidase domain-containing protein [Planctomycetes bacterium]|nr:trypsin-like peptidase domain-containing protein [Planctomycetota bacterium]